jgi:hypothetical protein
MKIRGLAIVFMLSMSALPSAAQQNNKVGTLTCLLGGNVGLLIGPVQRMTCAFDKSGGGRESYVATFSRLGLEPDLTDGDRMAWTVFAPNMRLAPQALAGKYVGAGKNVALAVGANTLVGGFKHTIALQPLSIDGKFSANSALGGARFRLRTNKSRI